MQYLLLFALVLGVNLLPAFGPPTWTLLVFARIRWHLDPVAIVILGTIAASIGRYLLALGARTFRHKLPERPLKNLTAASEALREHRGRTWAIFGLFVVSPLPSAQLFLAAGLVDIPLIPLTVAFAAGRLVSYSLYVAAASIAGEQLDNLLRQLFGSAWSIALQVGLLALVALLPFVDWSRFTRKAPAKPAVGEEG